MEGSVPTAESLGVNGFFVMQSFNVFSLCPRRTRARSASGF